MTFVSVGLSEFCALSLVYYFIILFYDAIAVHRTGHGKQKLVLLFGGSESVTIIILECHIFSLSLHETRLNCHV